VFFVHPRHDTRCVSSLRERTGRGNGRTLESCTAWVAATDRRSVGPRPALAGDCIEFGSRLGRGPARVRRRVAGVGPRLNDTGQCNWQVPAELYPTGLRVGVVRVRRSYGQSEDANVSGVDAERYLGWSCRATRVWLVGAAPHRHRQLDRPRLGRPAPRTAPATTPTPEDHFGTRSRSLGATEPCCTSHGSPSCFTRFAQRRNQRRDARLALVAALETFESTVANAGFADGRGSNSSLRALTRANWSTKLAVDLTPHEIHPPPPLDLVPVGPPIRIAARLFISSSPSTSTCARSYRKLDIKSCRGLRRASPRLNQGVSLWSDSSRSSYTRLGPTGHDRAAIHRPAHRCAISGT